MFGTVVLLAHGHGVAYSIFAGKWVDSSLKPFGVCIRSRGSAPPGAAFRGRWTDFSD
jgi:hypothetical protein